MAEAREMSMEEVRRRLAERDAPLAGPGSLPREWAYSQPGSVPNQAFFNEAPVLPAAPPPEKVHLATGDGGAQESVASPPAAPPVAPPPRRGGGGGGLLSHERKLSGIGRGFATGAEDASREAHAASNKVKDAEVELDRVRFDQAEIERAGAMEKLATSEKYQRSLQAGRKREEESIREARKESEELDQDARYSGVSRSFRQEQQAILGDKNSTAAQKASANSKLEKARDTAQGGSRLGSAIAMALATLGGNADQVFAQIKENARKREVDRRARERQAAQGRENVANIQERYASEDTRRLQDMKVELGIGKARANAMMAGTKSSEVLAQGQRLIAGIDQKTAETDAALEHQYRRDYFEVAKAGAGVAQTRAQLNERRAGREAAGGKVQELRAGADISFHPSADKDDKTAVQKKWVEFAPLRNAVRTLKDLAKEGTSWDATTIKLAEGAMQRVLNMQNQMQGAGTMQENEFNRAIKAYANPTGIAVMTDMRELWTKIEKNIVEDFSTQIGGLNATYTPQKKQRAPGLPGEKRIGQ